MLTSFSSPESTPPSRSPGAADRGSVPCRHLRAKLLKLTATGHVALRSIQSKQRAWADALGAKIGEAKLRQAAAVLTDVFQKLQSND